MRRTIGLLGAIGAIALLAAGCGSGSKSTSSTTATTAAASSGGALSKGTYDKQMAVIGKDLGVAFGPLPSAANAKQGATKLLKAQKDVRKLVAKLEAIKPPTKIKAAHLRLIKAVSKLADQFTPIIAKLQKGNFKAIGDVANLSALNDIQLAVNKIETAGYTINGTG